MQKFNDIDELIAAAPIEYKDALQNLRQTIQKFVPEAVEGISYGMPGYKYKGKYLIAFSAFKNHLSIFPGAGAVAKFQPQLKDFVTSKGTVQFTLEKPLPHDLLKGMIDYRIEQINSNEN